MLQTAVIIGSGSASFEMLRYLTERLPVMVTPRWVSTRIQPIAVRDVLHYLVGSAYMPSDVSRTFDIGDPDVLTYRQMMDGYAHVAGLPPRRIIPVPVLTPRLSSHWVQVVTPVPTRSPGRWSSRWCTRWCHEHDIAEHVPDPDCGLTGFERAVELALAKVQELEVDTSWASASTRGAPSDPLSSDPDWAGGSLYVDAETRVPGGRLARADGRDDASRASTARCSGSARSSTRTGWRGTPTGRPSRAAGPRPAAVPVQTRDLGQVDR